MGESDRHHRRTAVDPPSDHRPRLILEQNLDGAYDGAGLRIDRIHERAVRPPAYGRRRNDLGVEERVDNQIDVTTGTIKLKALFANDDDKLWPGQFVSARVVVDTFVDAKVVPAAAIRRGPNGTFVYAVDRESRAVVRPVEVLLEDEARAVIGRGIDSGAAVVTVGFAQLTDRRPVQIVAGEPSAKTSAPPAPGAAAFENEGPRARGSEERKRRGKDGEPAPQQRKGGTREAQQ